MRTRTDRKQALIASTQGLCPHCRALVPAKVVAADGQVLMRKHCPEHGPQTALISSDSAWYLAARSFQKPGAFPRQFDCRPERGCPEDCGLCEEHEQHTCLPIIEITDHCNLPCPICLVQNRNSHHLTLPEYEEALQQVIEGEGEVEVLNLSGGEPTLHPQLPEILRLSRRPEIRRVVVNTNGLAFAQEGPLLALFAREGVYAALQFDGFERETYRRMRGADLLEAKLKALENLRRYRVKTTLVLTLVAGINERAVGEVIGLVLREPHILSATLQPAAFCGAGTAFPRPQGARLTLPAVLDLITAQCGGVLTRDDFLPLPCSHPACFAFAYLLRMECGEFRPLARFVDLGEYRQFLANKPLLSLANDREEFLLQTINRLWSSAGMIPDSAPILEAIRAALREAFPGGKPLAEKERVEVGEQRVKSVFLHAFMDADTFDLARAVRCCTHYVKEGRRFPACVYNNLRRV